MRNDAQDMNGDGRVDFSDYMLFEKYVDPTSPDYEDLSTPNIGSSGKIQYPKQRMSPETIMISICGSIILLLIGLISISLDIPFIFLLCGIIFVVIVVSAIVSKIKRLLQKNEATDGANMSQEPELGNAPRSNMNVASLWTCPKCGRIYNNAIQSCKCGMKKPSNPEL